jgi:hypothetical protein
VPHGSDGSETAAENGGSATLTTSLLTTIQMMGTAITYQEIGYTIANGATRKIKIAMIRSLITGSRAVCRALAETLHGRSVFYQPSVHFSCA